MVKQDSAWDAAIHILSSPLLADKCAKYVDMANKEINVSQMLEDCEATWSSGEVLMARVAIDLYNGSGNAVLGDLVQVLDPNNLQVVLDAIGIYCLLDTIAIYSLDKPKQVTLESKKEQWAWSLDMDDYWDNEVFNSRDEAIDYGQSMAEVYDESVFYIGKVVPPQLRVDAYGVLDDLLNQVCDQVSEESLGWLHNLTEKQVEELEQYLTNAFLRWAKRNNHEPNFYTVQEIEEVEMWDFV